MIYCFDLDNTLCHTVGREYVNSTPNLARIEKLNKLFDEGHYIKIYTARGMGTYKGDAQKVEEAYRELTQRQLDEWCVKHHELVLGKISYDCIVDDKAITPEMFDQLAEQLEEIERCKSDIRYFFEKYCKVKSAEVDLPKTLPKPGLSS